MAVGQNQDTWVDLPGRSHYMVDQDSKFLPIPMWHHGEKSQLKMEAPPRAMILTAASVIRSVSPNVPQKPPVRGSKST